MLQTQTLKAYLPVFLIPAALMAICAYLAMNLALTDDDQRWFSIGITLDLMITIPLVYFLLIRKKSISKITVIPWIIGGMLLARALVGDSPDSLAAMATQYLLPLIELVVVSFIGYRIYQLTQSYKKQGSTHQDFLTAIKQSTEEVFGKGLAANLLAWELAVFYYGLIRWQPMVPAENQFTYHKKSSVRPLLIFLMFLVVVETFVLHLLIQLWSPVAAWIVTGISIYSLLWIIAQYKAMAYRPLVVENGYLYLRHGMVYQCAIPLSTIEEIRLDQQVQKNEGKALSLLPGMETSNVQLVLSEPVEVTGLYGMGKEFEVLSFKVDDAAKLNDKLA